MAREIDRVSIDEVEMMIDHYRGERCGVCGQSWEVHPPAALWRIMPIGFVPRPHPNLDPNSLGYPCHRTETFAQLGGLGIELAICNYLRPAGPVETNHVIEANRTGGVKRSAMKVFPADACPPMHMRPIAEQDRNAVIVREMVLEKAARIDTDRVPDKDIVTRVTPGRNGHHGNA